MFSKIKHRLKKLGFISIELVILAGVMLTAGGYGVAKLGSNASGSIQNETDTFNKLFEKELTEEEKKFLEFKNNIADNKVKTIYENGENAVSKDANSTININGIDCYVLEFNEDKTQTKLITKDIHDVRFDTGGHTTQETTHLGTNSYADKTYDYKYSTLKTWMEEFYRTQLGADSRILPTTVTYYTKDSYDSNLDTYTTGTIADQYVFALDAKEAKQYASKFRWNYANQMSGRGHGFWTTAGFRDGSGSLAWHVYYSGYFDSLNVSYSSRGARPAFWISLN